MATYIEDYSGAPASPIDNAIESLLNSEGENLRREGFEGIYAALPSEVLIECARRYINSRLSEGDTPTGFTRIG